jgi:hypothetical protein
MSLAIHSPLSPSLPDANIMQVSTKSEQNPSVSCLNYFPVTFADNCQIQDSGSGFFANAQNITITGGNFVVSLSCGLYKQLIIIHILSEQYSIHQY